MSDDIIADMIEIELPNDDSFNIIRETLTRMGVKHKDEKKLYQSAHILHKRGHFYICHFKEMLALDGKTTNLDDTDIARRNTIASLLVEWGLIHLLDEKTNGMLDYHLIPVTLKVLPFKEKQNWELIPKYTIGKRT